MRTRFRQYRHASVLPTSADFELASRYLANELLALFRDQHPRDAVHSAATARWLIEHDQAENDLVVAGLLHDVAKGNQRRVDRVAWVLAAYVGMGSRLADAESRFELRRAMARTAEHSAAGARLLLQAGATPAVAELTRLHHTAPGTHRVLALLQQADAAN
ncbi:MAG: HD domain-containing protein [Anaerolineaceae bacterium]